MENRVITFGNFKGGTGKTTNSTMSGIELARRGYKTLLVDLDPQANATNLYLKTKANVDGNGIAAFKQTLMAGIQNDNLKSTIINIMPNLDILPSSADFSFYPIFMEEKIRNYNDRVKYFAELLSEIKIDYNYIIIDVPPTISLITDSALYASDYCIIVMQTQERSLQGSQAFIEYMQDRVINTYQAPTLDLVGILPVLLKNGAPVDKSTLDSAKEIFGEENLFKITIKNMERLKRYDISGVTFGTRYDQRVEDTYKRVVDEIIERIEAIENV